MQKDSETEIVVVIPYYCGIAELDELCERLSSTLNQISENWNIILVDDCSPDAGWEKIQNLSKDEPRISGLKLSRNFGQHAAITAGIHHAKANWYVVMDCDLQDRPEDIELLYRKAVEENYEVVIAARANVALGKRRTLGSIVFNKILSWASGLEVSSRVGNFRIFSNKVAEAYRSFDEQFRFFPAIMAQLGFAPVQLSLPRSKREHSPSSYTFLKLLRLAHESIIGYSDKLLMITATIGVSITVLSASLAALYLGLGLNGYFEVKGFATITLLLLVLGGFQIFVTSLVGIYTGAVLRETKKRPIYIVDQKTW